MPFMKTVKTLLCLLLFFLTFAFAEDVTFNFVPRDGVDVRSVSLRGEFNNWGETPMTLQEDGSWAVTIDLEPGEYQYKFFINGEWPANMEDWQGAPVDPTADGYFNDGYDGQNAIRIVGGEVLAEGEVPDFDLADVIHNHDDPAYRSVADDKLVVRIRAKADGLESASVLVNGEPIPMVRQLWWRGQEMWRASLPLEATEYSFELEAADGSNATTDSYTFDGEVTFPELEWVSEQVFYQIFPERFLNGNPYNDALALSSDEYVFNSAGTAYGGAPELSGWTDEPGPSHCCHQYYGGDLAGVIKQLDYLQDLGVTAIYFNPIFDAGSAHGYDTHDYLTIAPHLGTNKTFQTLLELAHNRGMKIVLDFVPNHTGLGFWAFQDVIAKGEESAYWDWYFINEYPFDAGDTDAYTYWASAPSLPKLNMLNPETKAYMLDVAAYWIEQGIDGWRVDVVNEVLDAHGFFEDMRSITKELNPESYMVAEIWQLAPEWLEGDEFDSLMNYALGKDLILRYAGNADNALANAARTLSGLNQYYGTYGENVAAMGFNLMSSHDTERVLSTLDGGNLGDTPSDEAIAKLKVASTLLYALPGAPVTFQGDECGFLGKKSAPNTQDLHRYPLQWENCNEDLRAHYRALAEMRREYTALRSATFRGLETDANVLGFYRGEPNEVGEVLVLANGTGEAQTITMPAGTWRYTDRGGQAREGAHVELAPYTVRLFVRR